MSEKSSQSNDAVQPVDSALTTGIEKLIVDNDLLNPLHSVLMFVGDNLWLQWIAVFGIFLLIAVAAQWLVVNLIKRVTLRFSSRVDNQIGQLLKSPIFWTIALLGVLVAGESTGIGSDYRGLLISLVVSVLVFKWMVFTVRISKVMLAAASRRSKKHSFISPQTLPLFSNLAALAIIVFGVYFIFQAWHIDMTAWIASAGIIGIAVGFAAKDTLANLFSGVFIMADSPYRVGDYIVLDDSTTLRGKVTQIGIRSTRVLTRDDVEVTIPNSIMGNSKVINESGGPHVKYRLRVAVGVAYGSDIDRVRSVLVAIAEDSEEVCREPAPRVRMRGFGASSLDFELLVWIENPEFRGRVQDNLNQKVYKKFIQEKIEIPFSKHDLYIKELPASDSFRIDP